MSMVFNLAYEPEDISEDSSPVSEPVNLSEMKDYLRVAGFGDDSASDFTFDDTLIEEQIKEAREWCEGQTGCSLVAKTIRIIVTNTAGNIPVPHGPVTGTISITNQDGDAVDTTDIKIVGSLFPKIKTPTLENMTLVYDAGYTRATIPEGLRKAMMAYVAASYENRGDTKPDLSAAIQKCAPFIKYSAWG